MVFVPLTNYKMNVGSTSSVISVPGGSVIRIANTGSTNAYIAMGNDKKAATTDDMWIAAGTDALIGRPSGATHIAAITAAGTTTLSITTGDICGTIG